MCELFTFDQFRKNPQHRSQSLTTTQYPIVHSSPSLLHRRPVATRVSISFLLSILVYMVLCGLLLSACAVQSITEDAPHIAKATETQQQESAGASQTARSTTEATANATPMPPTEDVSAGDSQGYALPAPAPVGTVVYYEEQITLQTYPYEAYQTDAFDPRYQWPYKRFDMERFRLEAPTPEPRTYRLLVLENAYLKLSVMPELGGRIWQLIHKPSGQPIFYQNDVVKPTHWGNIDQLGWLGLGGVEWGIPVSEHGYDWGTPWGFIPLQHSEDLASVTIFTPYDGRLLNASITISLRSGAAGFEIEPTITNLAERALDFSFWHDAMLAPGTGKRPSASLQFILPNTRMTVHSTNDSAMPSPGRTFSWPIYQGRNLGQLDAYRQYLGYFEAPAAQGPFTAVYDPTYDLGLIRAYPAQIAQGSKVFVLGWQDALTSDNFTDDDSFYVEMHGGLAPTFDDSYRLPAAGQISWREQWYPVANIGTVTTANELLALRAQWQDEAEEPTTSDQDKIDIAIYPTRPIAGKIRLIAGALPAGKVAAASAALAETLPTLAEDQFVARPDLPYHGLLTAARAEGQSVGSEGQRNDFNEMTIQVFDSSGVLLLTHTIERE